MNTPESPDITIDDGKETGRTEAFSDGVFAVAITLLVLDVRVPSQEASAAAGGLVNALLERWPVYFAFVTSFLTILIMWVNHHRMFKMFKRSDHIFLMLNGLLLMGISLVPFTSSLLAEYLNQGDEAKIAAIIYATIFTLIALCFNSLWAYSTYKHRLIDPKIPQAWIDAVTKAYRFGPLLYVAAGLLALIHVAFGVGLIAGLAVFYALPSRSGENVKV